MMFSLCDEMMAKGTDPGEVIYSCETIGEVVLREQVNKTLVDSLF